jgi:hypothetical protein
LLFILIDHNMALGYKYSKQKRWWRQANVPLLLAFLIAMVVRRSDTDRIAQCGMSRATSETTGRCHRATTHSVLPQQPPGQQANKQQSTNTSKEMAVSMAMAMRRYVTVHIAQWRRSRASLEATGCRHWARIMSDNIKGTWLHWVFLMFFIVKTVEKGHGSTLRPLFLIGV